MRGSKLITPAVLVDIDGTLADSREREHLLENDPDWQRHSLACLQDPPVPANIALVNELARNNNIILCSGRSVVAKDLTKQWMKENGVAWNRLMLRPVGNYDNNATFKLSVVKRLEAEGYTFKLAIDDYHKTVHALIEYGIPTIHVVSYTSHTNPEELLGSGDIQA